MIRSNRSRAAVVALGAALGCSPWRPVPPAEAKQETRRRRRQGRQHPDDDGRDDHPPGARRHLLGHHPQGCRGRRREGQRRAASTPTTPTRPSRPSSSRPPSTRRSTASRSPTPTPRRLGGAIKAAVAAGIPVTMLNAGGNDALRPRARSATSARARRTPASAPARRSSTRAARTSSASSRSRASSSSRTAARASPRVPRGAKVERAVRQRPRRLRRHHHDPGQAHRGQEHRLPSSRSAPSSRSTP